MLVILYKWLFLSAWYMLLPLHTTASHSVASPHPFYISVTEMNHNAKDQTLEISCKMFFDDLESTLEQNYKTKLDITNAQQKSMADKLIADYIKKHLAITVDNKSAPMQYVGYEIDKESAYCYFQISHIASMKKLNITNSLLYDFNTGQINIMHVIVNGHRQSTKLDYPQQQAAFTF